MAVHFEYQGKHYEFADGTTPDTAKQKIQAFLGEQPTTPKEEKPKNFYQKGMEVLPDFIPDMAKHQLIGAAEGAMHIGSMLPSMFGGAVETGQAIIDKALGNENAPKTHQEFEDRAIKGMDSMSYTPKSPLGQDIAELAGKAITEFGIPMMGIAPGLPNKAHLGPRKPVLDTFKKGEKIDPAVAEFEKQRYIKTKQAEATKEAEQVRQQLRERDAQQTAQYGYQPDLFQEDIIAKQREQAQAELEGMQRDVNGPQGDLFAGMGERPAVEKPSGLSIEDGGPSKRNAPDNMIGEVQEQAQRTLQDVEGLREGEQIRAGTYPEQVPDNSLNWTSPKQMEIDQLWEEKMRHEKALQEDAKKTAWERHEAQQEPLSLEPQQGSMLMENPQERTTYRPNSNQPLGQTAFGKGQRGAIDPNGIWDGLGKLADGVKVLLKDGRRGTVVSSREIPNKTMKAWEEYRSELHEQAFQGYMNGQHTFEQATKIYDHLIEQNKDKLYQLSQKAAGSKFVPKVLIEGESRPKLILSASEIDRVFTGPLGQSQFGKNQRGSIGFFGKDPFEKYAEKIKQAFPDATPEEIKASWEKKQVKHKEQQVQKAVGNMAPTLKENLSVYRDVGKEDALAALKTSPDFEKPTLGGMRDVMLSRGRIGVEKLQNEGIKAALSHMIGLRDNGKIRANKVLHGEDGVMRNLRKLEKFFGAGRAWDVFKQRFEGQFKENYQYNLDKDQMKIKDQLDKIFEDIRTQMEQISGKKINKIANYFPSMFYGDFVSAVRDADGRLVAYVTEKSANKVREATDHVLGKLGEGFTAEEPKYRKEILKDRFKGQAGLAQHFEAMLDLLSSDDPVVQKAQSAVQDALNKRAMDTRRVKDRMKFKSGVEGAEGQKGWQKDNQNYYAAKDVLENYVRAFEDWKANMETSKFLSEIKDIMPDKKNTHNILSEYFDDMRAIRDANSRVATKIDNDMSNAIGHSVGSNLTGLARGSANTLTKLWLGFWNPAAMAQNVLQPVHSVAKLVDLAANGGSKDVITPILLGFAKSLVDGASITSNKMFKTDLTARAKYLKDFEVIKPGLIEAKDRTKIGHVLEKNVVAGGQMVSEAFARATTFNIFETYLQKSGYSKEQSYAMAKNLTHEYMVNYEGYAKSGLVGNTGVVGEMAGRLQSFKINQFTQLANYIQTLKQTKNPAPLATALAMSVAMAGVSGMIGMDMAEGIYGVLVNLHLVDPRTRSPRQMAMDFGHTVGFNGKSADTVSFGAPTAVSGKWLSGSLTTNLVGDLSWRNVAPIFAGIGNAISTVGGVALKAATKGIHNVPNSEIAGALNTVTPSVLRGRWEDRLLTDKEGRISSPFTGEVVYQKGPQDENLFSKFTNLRSKERGETVTRKALLSNQEKNIQDELKYKVQNLEKLFDESVRMGKSLDGKFVAKELQSLIDYGTDPNQTVEQINAFIIKNHLGDWFQQQVVSGNITLSNLDKKVRALQEKEKIGK